MHRRKVFFSENIPEFTSFSLDSGLFLQDLNSCDFISWAFISSPHIILGKEVPRILSLGIYFQWHFVYWTSQNWDFLLKLLFPGFFFRNCSFLSLFYIAIFLIEHSIWFIFKNEIKRETLGVSQHYCELRCISSTGPILNN